MIKHNVAQLSEDAPQSADPAHWKIRNSLDLGEPQNLVVKQPEHLLAVASSSGGPKAGFPADATNVRNVTELT